MIQLIVRLHNADFKTLMYTEVGMHKCSDYSLLSFWIQSIGYRTKELHKLDSKYTDET